MICSLILLYKYRVLENSEQTVTKKFTRKFLIPKKTLVSYWLKIQWLPLLANKIQWLPLLANKNQWLPLFANKNQW